MPYFFVAGNSRSGTTMMGRILGNHSSIFTFPELHFFEQLWSPTNANKIITKSDALQTTATLFNISEAGYFGKREFNKYQQQSENIVSSIDEKQLTKEKIYESVLISVCKHHQKQYPCEQTPQNIFYINEILKSFPDSYFINMVCDPRDILLSQKRKWKRRFLGGKHATWFETLRAWNNYHPITISKLWNASVSAGLKNKNEKRVITVQFESLLENPESVIKKICADASIEFQSQMLNIPVVGSSSGNDSSTHKGINAERANSWKGGGLNSAEIWLCQKMTAGLMKELNYKNELIRPNYLLVGIYYLLFPIKLGFALILNLHRMKNIADTLRRRLKN